MRGLRQSMNLAGEGVPKLVGGVLELLLEGGVLHVRLGGDETGGRFQEGADFRVPGRDADNMAVGGDAKAAAIPRDTAGDVDEDEIFANFHCDSYFP
jgi:hypothetical protein